MRIAYVSAGAAGMYCGSCLSDNTLATALQDAGHDVALIPTYTPLRTDETDVSIDRVFYGAVSVYLEQRFPAFRRAPRILDRILAHPWLLKRLSGLGVSTDADDLGAMTLSVLRGEEGHQRRELERLVDWLAAEFRPEIVHVTNSMFLGLGATVRRELDVPVFCSVQGEDLFLENLSEPWRSAVRDELEELGPEVDGFIAPSRYYAGFMADYLGVRRGRFRTVPLGIHLEGHDGPAPLAEEPYVIGYLARVCPEKGLHLLVDAFRHVAGELGPDAVRLRAAGYLATKHREYLRRLTDRVAGWGLGDAFEYVGEVSRSQKIRFLQSLHVLSVPTTYVESKGLFVLESLANGTPVVQPDHGSFPELLDATDGGLLVEPGSPEALAEGLLKLQSAPATRREMGLRGRQVVRERYSAATMAESMLRAYDELLSSDDDPGNDRGRSDGAVPSATSGKTRSRGRSADAASDDDRNREPDRDRDRSSDHDPDLAGRDPAG